MLIDIDFQITSRVKSHLEQTRFAISRYGARPYKCLTTPEVELICRLWAVYDKLSDPSGKIFFSMSPWASAPLTYKLNSERYEIIQKLIKFEMGFISRIIDKHWLDYTIIDAYFVLCVEYYLDHGAYPFTDSSRFSRVLRNDVLDLPISCFPAHLI